MKAVTAPAKSRIKKEDYEEIEELRYKVKNELLKLIGSLQTKAKKGGWKDDFSENNEMLDYGIK